LRALGFGRERRHARRQPLQRRKDPLAGGDDAVDIGCTVLCPHAEEAAEVADPPVVLARERWRQRDVSSRRREVPEIERAPYYADDVQPNRRALGPGRWSRNDLLRRVRDHIEMVADTAVEQPGER